MSKTKGLIICLVALFLLGFSGLAYADSTSMYSDLPANHWAYAAVKKLAQEGIVQGDKGMFYGDRVMSRYEMAGVVANAITKMDKADAESKILIQKLANEFADELKKLDVRLTKMESKSSSFKTSGDLRFRYRINSQPSSTNRSSEVQNKIEERARLKFDDENFAPNLSYHLRILASNLSNSQANNATIAKSTTAAFCADRFELDWQRDKTTLQLGRSSFDLGKNLILWSAGNPIDGFNLNYKMNKNWKVTAGYADLASQFNYGATSTGISVSSCNAQLASIQYQNGLANASLAYLRVMNPGDTVVGSYPYNFKQYDLTAEIPFGNWLLHGEAITNQADNLPKNAEKNGYLFRLQYNSVNLKTPGSTAYMLEYDDVGNWAIDSTYGVFDFNGCAGNGIGKDGCKGWGIGVDTVIAPNCDFEVWGYWWKPYDADRTGTTFTKYAPTLFTRITARF